MRNILFAAITVAGLIGATAAMADEFTNPQEEQQGYAAYNDQQTLGSQDADPTTPNSIRSHGHP